MKKPTTRVMIFGCGICLRYCRRFSGGDTAKCVSHLTLSPPKVIFLRRHRVCFHLMNFLNSTCSVVDDRRVQLGRWVVFRQRQKRQTCVMVVFFCARDYSRGAQIPWKVYDPTRHRSVGGLRYNATCGRDLDKRHPSFVVII
jgi:hypothetical protein